MEAKKPKGIVAIGSINGLILGAWMLLVGLIKLSMIGTTSWDKLFTNLGFTKRLAIFAYVQLIPISILYIVSAYGLQNLKKWARKMTVYLATISLIINCFILGYAAIHLGRSIVISSGNTTTLRLNLFHYIGGIFYPIFIIYYLTRPKIKEQFR